MKLNNSMSMVDVIKLLKAIAGDDEEMLGDIRKSLYNMAEADDLPDDQIDSWVKAYPEDKHESLRKLFEGPAVEVVKTKIEGGKDQPPADINEDTEVKGQLDKNQKELDKGQEEPDGMTDAEIDAQIDAIMKEVNEQEQKLSEEEQPESSEEPEGNEEQDETTRNIIAGLSDK